MAKKTDRKLKLANAIKAFQKAPSLVNTNKVIAAARAYRRQLRKSVKKATKKSTKKAA